ncbi:MAG TPA: lytic transglycosylase domain-containing protein, partial [Polyangiaceae bacterium]
MDTANDTASDPELRALGKAEKALFPWALRGVRSSFSFDDSPLQFQSDAQQELGPGSAWVKDLRLPATFPNVDGRILTYLDFYRVTPEGKAILRGWAKKRGRYEALITSILAKAGVPTDLVWQSLVESGHNPTIRSPAGAAGLWQFMAETARMYGLTVDRWVDERLDPERSTQAAARVMGDLYQRFGNWELALAAYNMGDAGLMRAIRKYNTNDFWVLSRYEAGLPMETALYVPRIIALTIAMQNPKTFGIDEIEPDPACEFEPATVPSGQLLSGIARCLGVTDEALVRLNPQLLAQRTPPSAGSDKVTARVLVPLGM